MPVELLDHAMDESNLGMPMEESQLVAAWRSHQAGRFADAARLYHALLAAEPDNADALHLFGVLHFENKYFSRAVELIGRAVALRPKSAAFHANLAEAYRALSENDQAVKSCQAALELQPAYPEAANNLGLALHSLGRYADAIAQFRAALNMRPEFALAQNNMGTSLRELGRTEEAIAAFRGAVELDPRLALAHSNLGQMLIDQGEPEAALAHCQEAVRLDPGFAAGHNNLGNAYRVLERWTEAHSAYDEALRLASDLARVHANRGLALQLEGKTADAFVYFRRATELAPDDTEMWRYLADAHAADEDAAAALPCWQRIVALQPNEAGGHSALGWALQDEGRLAEAAACYGRALELQPGHLDALMNTGDLHEELGELAQAEAFYRQAQSTHPWSPAPLGRLATLLRGRLPEADRQTVEARLQSLSAKSPARGPLLFGLAYVLDAQGDYAAAAASLAEANALALEENRKRARSYDLQRNTALVDRIIAGFTPDLFTRLAGDGGCLSGTGDDSPHPVFVFGLPRSGTTLVEQVLASHSRVHGAGELPLARQVFQSVPDVLGLEDDMAACLKVLDAGHVRELSQRHREGLDAILRAELGVESCATGSGANKGVRNQIASICDLVPDTFIPPDRVVDKMPDNYLYLGLLALLFPRATFIHVYRDPRDVALSCWMTNFRSIRWANDPEHLADRFRQHRRLMTHWQAVLPVPLHEVHYERLVEDFEPEARRLVAACGLEWEPACLQFHETKRLVRTASVTQVRQPLYRTALARWRHYETALAELFEKLPSD